MKDIKLESKEKIFEKNQYNISYLTFFYFKQVFNIKNLLMFVILFLLILTLYNSIGKIINANAFNLSDRSITLNTWTTIIFTINIYFTLLLNYIYLYLKKCNFTQVNSIKNTISNLIIIFLIFIIFYSFLYLLFQINLSDYKYYSNGEKAVPFKNINVLFFNMCFFNLIAIALLSIFASKRRTFKFQYLFLLVIFILNFIFFLWMLKIISAVSANEYLKFLNILKIESSIFLILIFVNLFKRVFQNYRYKF
ncbi:MAG: hypothetical protein HPAVJP_1530 [Candidatus Hepatoplasma vulgare]|nr:MAG: hypothetical protein HPAVJP_1530 [Candidatus Hepatoplasma sp.]